MERIPLEVSRQDIPVIGESDIPMAPSRPLHELAESAPRLPSLEELDLGRTPFVTSNDESASLYAQTTVRTQLPDYRAATNRTAVIIGEGALSSALPFISEDTIILLDKSPEACAWMQLYIDVLRNSETIDEWGDSLFRTLLPRVGRNGLESLASNISYQAAIWHEAGYGHAADDEETYARSRQLAREKTIIPWCADITSFDDMAVLGDALHALDASVTMMNLTNVLQADRTLKFSKVYVERLRALPVTAYAPILTTSNRAKPASELYALGATGPFFGLNNLAEHGGRATQLRPGAVIMREYGDRRTTREANLDLLLHNTTAKTWDPLLGNTAVRGLLTAGLTARYGPRYAREIAGRLFGRQEESAEGSEAAE